MCQVPKETSHISEGDFLNLERWFCAYAVGTDIDRSTTLSMTKNLWSAWGPLNYGLLILICKQLLTSSSSPGFAFVTR